MTMDRRDFLQRLAALLPIAALMKKDETPPLIERRFYSDGRMETRLFEGNPDESPRVFFGGDWAGLYDIELLIPRNTMDTLLTVHRRSL